MNEVLLLVTVSGLVWLLAFGVGAVVGYIAHTIEKKAEGKRRENLDGES